MYTPAIPLRQSAAPLASNGRTTNLTNHDSEAGRLMRLIERRRTHLAIAEGLPFDGLLDLARRPRDHGRVDEVVWTLRLLIERVQGVRQ